MDEPASVGADGGGGAPGEKDDGYAAGPFFFLLTMNASAASDARSAAPSAPPTAPPTTAVLCSGHAAAAAAAAVAPPSPAPVAADPDTAVTVTVGSGAVPVPSVTVAVAVAASSVPTSVDTTAELLPQQFVVSDAGRQQYVPLLHWSTLHDATLGPPSQSVVAGEGDGDQKESDESRLVYSMHYTCLEEEKGAR